MKKKKGKKRVRELKKERTNTKVERDGEGERLESEYY
jgi:hypothetical protein